MKAMGLARQEARERGGPDALVCCFGKKQHLAPPCLALPPGFDQQWHPCSIHLFEPALPARFFPNAGLFADSAHFHARSLDPPPSARISSRQDTRKMQTVMATSETRVVATVGVERERARGSVEGGRALGRQKTPRAASCQCDPWCREGARAAPGRAAVRCAAAQSPSSRASPLRRGGI